MYFPYLRCKQFELLALREISSKIINPSNISPLLEPVKKSTSALEKAIETLVQNGINFTIILNPIHGEFSSDPAGIAKMISAKLANYHNFQFGVILNQSTNLSKITSNIQLINFSRPIVLVHTDRFSEIDSLRQWSQTYSIKYNLYQENFPARRYRDIITSESKVLLGDKFKIQEKNSDYQNTPDEFLVEKIRAMRRVDSSTSIFQIFGDQYKPIYLLLHQT